MMKQIKNGAFLRGVMVGTGAGLLCSLAGCLVLSWALNGEKLDMESLGYGVMAVTFLSGIMGSVAARTAFNEKVLPLCACTGAVYFALLLGVGALLFDGKMKGVGETLLLVIGTSIGVAFVGFNRKSKRRTGKYRVPNS